MELCLLDVALPKHKEHRDRWESNYPRQIMDVSFKICGCCNCNGSVTISPEAGLYQVHHLLFNANSYTAIHHKLSSCTDHNKSFNGSENMALKIKYLLTCSVGVGSEQTLELGSPSGYNS